MAQTLRHIGFNIDHGGLDYGEIISLSKLGEEASYDSIAFYDHLYSMTGENELCLETWSLLPALALESNKVKLLPLVTNNLFRHPGVLAKMAASLDNLSAGRLIFGIGAGWYEKEALDFGYKFPNLKTRLEMLDESLQVISKLWTEDKATFKGRYYSLEDAESLPKPTRKPPILIGGKARGVLELVAKHADMCNFTLRGLEVKRCEKLLQTLQEICDKQGRDYNLISKTISGPCFFAESKEDLEKELVQDSKRRGMSLEETRKFYESSSLFGTVDQIIDQVEQYEKVGIEGMMLRFNKQKQAEKARAFSTMIMPKVKG